MSIETPLRAAVIGCGRIGAGFSAPGSGTVLTHASAYDSSALTRLVAVCDADPDTAQATAERWNVAGWHTSVTELLEAVRPHVVSICTPDSTHAAIAEEVLRFPSVRGVLAEKPLATTASAAERIATLARERGVVLGVNYSRRWSEGIVEAARMIRSGRLGAVRAVAGHYANGWLHNGTHWIDLARMIVGEIVAARALRVRPAAEADDPSLDVELEFDDGATGVVLGHPGEGLSFFEMDVFCERGRLRLSDLAQTIDIDELLPSPTYAGFLQHSRVVSSQHPLGVVMLRAIEDLAARIEDGADPACTGEDGVAALRVAESVKRSCHAWDRLEVTAE